MITTQWRPLRRRQCTCASLKLRVAATARNRLQAWRCDRVLLVAPLVGDTADSLTPTQPTEEPELGYDNPLVVRVVPFRARVMCCSSRDAQIEKTKLAATIANGVLALLIGQVKVRGCGRGLGFFRRSRV